MTGARLISTLGLGLVVGCSFEPSGGSGSPGAAGGPDASGSIGGRSDAAIDDPGDGDGGASVVQLVTPVGPATTVGDLGGNGGSSFSADCGAGRVVTGIDAEDNDFGLCRLRAVCSRMTVQNDVVDVIDQAATQSFGDEGSYYDIEPVDCPVGSALVAFEGSESDGGLVQHLRLWCAPIVVSGGNISLGAAVEVPDDLGSPSNDGSGAGDCPAGQLAAGIAGRAGTILDRFELRCYQVALAPE